MKIKTSFYLLMLIFVSNSMVKGQVADSIKIDSVKKFRVSISVNHNTHLNYFGRTDSIRSSGLFPTLELNFGPHIYARASAIFSYGSGSNAIYNGTVLQGGYQFNSKNKWLGDFYFAKILYKDQSTLVQSALKSQAGFTISFLNKYLNLNAGADAKFSDKTDFGATGTVDHLFRAYEKNKTRILIDPFAAIYAGTQNFSYSYREKPGQLFDVFSPGRENTVNVKSFNILAYEVGMPVILVQGKFQFSLVPSYILPKNLLTVPARPDLSERGENLFYLTSGVKYNLR